MQNFHKPAFNSRAFVALGLVCSGLGLPVTGLANHLYQIAPLDQVRHAWMAAHNSLGVVFLGFSLAHVVLHRRVIWQYVRGVAAHLPRPGREGLAAALLVGVSTFFAVAHAFLLER